MKQAWLLNPIKFSIATVASTILALGLGSQAVLSQRVVNVNPSLDDQSVPSDTSIYGVFEPTNGVGIDLKSVKIYLNNQDVTRNSTITNNFFSYRPQQELPSGSNNVRVVFNNTQGQNRTVSWNFTVGDSTASQNSTNSPTVSNTQSLRPLFTSHRSGDEINTRGFTLEGQTLPNATVDIKVTSALPVLGGVFDVKVGQSTLINQTVTADNNGNFIVQVPAPSTVTSGLRYNVTAVASNGNETSRPVELTLVQD